MNEAQQQAALADIARRHSTLHDVDKQCCKVMTALTKMIGPCGEHKLLAELDAVHHALVALRAATKQKFERLQ